MASVVVPQEHGDTAWLVAASRVGEAAAPFERAHDRDGTFAVEAFEEVRSSGLLTASIPAALGGGGLSHAGTAAVLRRIGRASPATAVTLSMHHHTVATLVWRHRHGLGDGAGLRRIAGANAHVATSGASDWLASSGSATRVEGGYRVSATKRPISGAPTADLLVATARDEEHDTVVHFSTPMGADGVTVRPSWDAMGLRATGSDTVVLDDVLVPDDAVVLTRPASGWPTAWTVVLGAAVPLIMSAYLGIGDRLVELAVAAVRAGDRARGREQDVGAMLNRLATAEDAVAATVAASDDLAFEATDDHAAFVLTRKAVAAESLLDVARAALEPAGGRAFSRTWELERLHRDVHGCVFHPLPGPAQRRFCGRLALGLDPVG